MTAPRRWVIDGDNVVGARPDGWWRDRPAARRRLIGALGAALRRGALDPPVHAIFDGRVADGPAEPGLRVSVAAAPGPDAADREIAALVAADTDASSLVVVTSDAALAAQVAAAGARVVGAGAFRRDALGDV